MGKLHYLTMHPDNPQPRLIQQVAAILQSGGLIAYPTDSTYALGCLIEQRNAINSLRKLRDLNDKHPLTLMCASIAQASQYCHVDNQAFSLFKQYTPGPYTFILPATKEVPKPAQGTKRKVVGIRIPQHPIALALLEALDKPLLTTTLWIPGDPEPLHDPQEILEKTRGSLDLIVDGGIGGSIPTTVIDLTGNSPELIRAGAGSFLV